MNVKRTGQQQTWRRNEEEEEVINTISVKQSTTRDGVRQEMTVTKIKRKDSLDSHPYGCELWGEGQQHRCGCKVV
jgi:hypothetical protein